MKYLTIIIALLMTLASPVAAQDFAKAYAAYKAEDYATAFKEWTSLAEQGNADAQYYLGMVYYDGQGVPQDYTMAHMWYNIAAANGAILGGVVRDNVAEKMTAAAVAKAQAMAGKCMSSGYTKCGY